MASKIQEVRQGLRKIFKEREEIIDGLLVAILSKENIFLLGKAGTAKSALINAVAQAFGGKYFPWLMTKLTTPEELFGPVSLKAMTENRFERVTDNKLPQAHFVFLDEVFKGSSANLNTLLTAINERKFHNGGAAPMDLPLQTVLGASNELPQGEDLAPFYDRFALRFITEPLRDNNNFLAMLSEGLDLSQLPKGTMKDLADEQNAAAKVKVDQSILVLIGKIRAAIENEGFYVSDRKYAQALKLIKSYAYLNGHQSVQPEDLQVLIHVLWSAESDRAKVRRHVLSICNPMGEKISKIMDAVREIPALLDAKKLRGLEAHGKAKEMQEKLEALGDPNKHPNLKQALIETDKMVLMIVEDHLGVKQRK